MAAKHGRISKIQRKACNKYQNKKHAVAFTVTAWQFKVVFIRYLFSTTYSITVPTLTFVCLAFMLLACNVIILPRNRVDTREQQYIEQ